jgi:hypothetical protein
MGQLPAWMKVTSRQPSNTYNGVFRKGPDMRIAYSLLAALALCACAANDKNSSARAWQHAECNRVIDKEDRDRCMRRADDYYGSVSREAEKAPAKR